MNQNRPSITPSTGPIVRPGRRRRPPGNMPARCSLAVAVLLAAGAGFSSCRTTAPTGSGSDITLSLDAVPLLLKADSASVSSIWATVLQSGHPVSDSTVVYFAASLGEVTPEAVTKDGLARATFTPGSTPGLAAIIAQVKAVRDTVLITIY